MTTKTMADSVREKSEQISMHLFLPSRASEEATIATAEGLLAGISSVLVQRLGTERAYQIVARAGDILDRVLLDAQRPVKPSNQCGQV